MTSRILCYVSSDSHLVSVFDDSLSVNGASNTALIAFPVSSGRDEPSAIRLLARFLYLLLVFCSGISDSSLAWFDESKRCLVPPPSACQFAELLINR